MSSWTSTHPFKIKPVKKVVPKPVLFDPQIVDTQPVVSLLTQDDYMIGIGVVLRKSDSLFGQEKDKEKEKEKEKTTRIRQSFEPYFPPKYKFCLTYESQNSCLESLSTCDYIFLFNEHVYPNCETWWEPFVANAIQYGCHMFLPSNELPMRKGTVVLPKKPNIAIQFFSRECIRCCGGFNPNLSHEDQRDDYAHRVHMRKLTPGLYCDFPKSLELFGRFDTVYPTGLSKVPFTNKHSYVPFQCDKYLAVLFDPALHSLENLESWLAHQTQPCIVFQEQFPTKFLSVGYVLIEESFWLSVQTFFLDNRSNIQGIHIVDFNVCVDLPILPKEDSLAISTIEKTGVLSSFYMYVPNALVLSFCSSLQHILNNPLYDSMDVEKAIHRTAYSYYRDSLQLVPMRYVLLILGTKEAIQYAIQYYAKESSIVIGVVEGERLSFSESVLTLPKLSIVHAYQWIHTNYTNILGVFTTTDTSYIEYVAEFSKHLYSNVHVPYWIIQGNPSSYWLNSNCIHQLLQSEPADLPSMLPKHIQAKVFPIATTKYVKIRTNVLEKLQAFCIYFPQFHAVPENDAQFYKGFTDIQNLDILSKRGVHVESPSVKHLPISNRLDYDLKRNPELVQAQIDLLTKYNIQGFAMYYYWFSTNTVTQKNMIFKDVIDRFFFDTNMRKRKLFFIWANENWTNNKAFGESKHEISNSYMPAQNSKNAQNLAQYFQSKHYLKIDNKPVLFLHHPQFMEKKQIANFHTILVNVCKRLGFDGIHLVMNSMFGKTPGYIHYQHHLDYKDNAMFVKKGENGTVIDYEDYIHKKPLTERMNTLVFDFDNRARLVQPDRLQYASVCTGATHENHVHFINRVLHNYETFQKKSPVEDILLINSFNEWGEKMAIEPSNEKGTYYLDLIQKIVYPKKKIVFVSHCVNSGTYYYYKYFCHFLPLDSTLYLRTRHDLSSIPVSSIKVFYLNSLYNLDISMEYILELCKALSNAKVPIYMICHDYQWLFPLVPNPLIDVLHKQILKKECCAQFQELLTFVKQIFFPSVFLYTKYVQLLDGNDKILNLLQEKRVVVANPDFALKMSNLHIPPLLKTIHIAYVGRFFQLKGSDTFAAIAKNKPTYKNHQLKYHAFSDGETSNTITFYGSFEDTNIIHLLHAKQVHIVVFFGKWPETHGYLMTKVMNSGLPIVYFNIGSFPERFSQFKGGKGQEKEKEKEKEKELGKRLFPFSEFEHLHSSLESAIDFVLHNHSQSNVRSTALQYSDLELNPLYDTFMNDAI